MRNLTEPERLRATIAASGLSIEQWAKQMAGVERSTAFRWLAGRSRIPKPILDGLPPRAECPQCGGLGHVLTSTELTP